MPQSLSQILVHLVFSTKHREAVLADDIRDELHAYIRPFRALGFFGGGSPPQGVALGYRIAPRWGVLAWCCIGFMPEDRPRAS